jgi:hypothetical protein
LMNKETQVLCIQIIMALKKNLVIDAVYVICEYICLLNKIKFDFRTVKTVLGSHVIGNWIGEYTIGSINFTDAKVWFKSSGTKTFKSPYFDRCDVEKMCETTGKLELKTNAHSGYFSKHSLQSILNDLKFEMDDNDYVFVKSTTKLINMLASDYWWHCKDKYSIQNEVTNCDYGINKTDKIIINRLPTTVAWIIHKMDKVIEELQEVLKKYNSMNVT